MECFKEGNQITQLPDGHHVAEIRHAGDIIDPDQVPIDAGINFMRRGDDGVDRVPAARRAVLCAQYHQDGRLNARVRKIVAWDGMAGVTLQVAEGGLASFNIALRQGYPRSIHAQGIAACACEKRRGKECGRRRR